MIKITFNNKPAELETGVSLQEFVEKYFITSHIDNMQLY